MSTSDSLSDTIAAAAAAAASAPQEVLQQGQNAQRELQGAAASSPQPQVNAAGENLQCQWQGCGERCSSPEALYVSWNALTRMSKRSNQIPGTCLRASRRT